MFQHVGFLSVKIFHFIFAFCKEIYIIILICSERETQPMDAFSMEIAGLVVKVQPLFETTREYCREYLSDGNPMLYISVQPDDLGFEQMMFEQEAIREGMKIRKFTGPFLERASIQRRVAETLLHRNTLLLHGSTVAVDGYAYLFTAPCGTGKSTHTRLWREAFGNRAIMVNDDKTFLRIDDGEVFAFGSPWSGKHGLHTNICLPLKGICILSRGIENEIMPMSSSEGYDFLYHQTFAPEDPEGQNQLSVLVNALVENVALWKMYCNKNPDAALTAYAAMAYREKEIVQIK